MLAPSDASKLDVARLAAMDAGRDGCFYKPDVSGLAAPMDARPIGRLYKPDVTRFGRGCSPDGCSPHRPLVGPDVTRLAGMDARPIRCF